MLYLIGVGINEYDSLSYGSVEILKNSDMVYVERFTGFLSDDFIIKITSILKVHEGQNPKDGVEVQLVKRWFIEDGREILENSLKKKRLHFDLWRSPYCNNL